MAFRLRKPCSRAQPHQGSTACRGNKKRLYRPSVTATTGMEYPERRRPVGQSCLQDPKVTQRSFDLRRPLRKRFAKSRSTARYVGAALIRKIPTRWNITARPLNLIRFQIMSAGVELGANTWQSADGGLEVCPRFMEPVVDSHSLGSRAS